MSKSKEEDFANFFFGMIAKDNKENMNLAPKEKDPLEEYFYKQVPRLKRRSRINPQSGLDKTEDPERRS